MMRSPMTLALGAAILLASGRPLIAADAVQGARLAQQWCANCHVVGKTAAPAVQQGPPGFPVIAHDMSEEQLRTFLAHPHPPMPDLSLSRAEIDDLIAYITALR